MTKVATFTKAEVQRAVKAVRELDPRAVVEIVTPKGTIRILPTIAESSAAISKSPPKWGERG